MGLMDKVRAQGTQIAQMAQETAREGKVKLDQAQAKRRADAMFRDLGATVYAERTGRGTPDSQAKIDRLVDALSRQEASQGLGDPDGSGPPGSTPPGGTPADDTPAADTPPEGTPGGHGARQLAASRQASAPAGSVPGWVAGVLGRGGGRDAGRGGGGGRGRRGRHRVAVRAEQDPHLGQPLDLLQ